MPYWVSNRENEPVLIFDRDQFESFLKDQIGDDCWVAYKAFHPDMPEPQLKDHLVDAARYAKDFLQTPVHIPHDHLIHESAAEALKEMVRVRAPLGSHLKGIGLRSVSPIEAEEALRRVHSRLLEISEGLNALSGGEK